MNLVNKCWPKQFHMNIYLSRNLYDVPYYLYNTYTLFKILQIFHYVHSSLSLCVYSTVKMVRIKFWNFFFTRTYFHRQGSYDHDQNGILKLKYHIFQKENVGFRGVNKCWLNSTFHNIFDYFCGYFPYDLTFGRFSQHLLTKYFWFLFRWKLCCISFQMPCRMSSHDVLSWRKNSKHKAHFKTKSWIFHENPNAKKRTFSKFCQLWSTPVAHMLMIWASRFWGLTSIYLKSFHLKYHGLKRNIHLGGSKNPFFVYVPGCWNNYLHFVIYV